METIEKPLASQISREARIRSILEESRTLAYSALDDLMYEAFLDVGHALSGVGESDPADASDPASIPSVCGLSARSLRQIKSHFDDGNLAEWLAAGTDGDKTFYLRDFLNLNSLEMKEFRKRHPNAFSRWTAEQDKSLLSDYQKYTDSCGRVPWDILSSVYGRNVNALKLRLEKLGVDLGAEAGRSRRPGGFAR
jgi:hypothetical protein